MTRIEQIKDRAEFQFDGLIPAIIRQDLKYLLERNAELLNSAMRARAELDRLLDITADENAGPIQGAIDDLVAAIAAMEQE